MGVCPVVVAVVAVAAVAVVLGRYVYEQYTHSELYGADDESDVIVTGQVPPTKEP